MKKCYDAVCWNGTNVEEIVAFTQCGCTLDNENKVLRVYVNGFGNAPMRLRSGWFIARDTKNRLFYITGREFKAGYEFV